MAFEYDDNDVRHRLALAAALLAALADEDVIEYPSECELTREADARLLQMLTAAGCSREQIGEAMRLETGERVH